MYKSHIDKQFFYHNSGKQRRLAQWYLRIADKIELKFLLLSSVMHTKNSSRFFSLAHVSTIMRNSSHLLREALSVQPNTHGLADAQVFLHEGFTQVTDLSFLGLYKLSLFSLPSFCWKCGQSVCTESIFFIIHVLSALDSRYLYIM